MSCRRLFFLLFFFFNFFGFFIFSASPALATCACETEDGEIFTLSSSEAITGDEDCDIECVDRGYLSGHEYSDDDFEREAVQQAQEQIAAYEEQGLCGCYCGDESRGARLVGNFQAVDECQAECETLSLDYVACATTFADAPLADPLCWKLEECSAEVGIFDPNQPTRCETGMHYCYPKPEATTLNVSFGGTEKVFSIGEYINAVYTWGLGAAGLIAVVFFMIGGVQYMIGSSIGSIEVAKKKMSGALTGLIILLAAYLLLATVNPSLTHLSMIRLPKIKPTLFLEGSCEDYRDQGYTVVAIEDAAEECGDQGTVTKSPENVDMGASCLFKACPGKSYAGCASLGGGYSCLSCGEAATTAAAKKGFSASAETCAVLTPSSDALSEGQRYRCSLIQDLDYAYTLARQGTGAENSNFYSSIAAAAGAFDNIDEFQAIMDAINTKTTAYCGLIAINCGSINSCNDYDNVQILAGERLQETIELDSAEDAFAAICSENPCDDQVKDAPCKLSADEDSWTYKLGIGPLTCRSSKSREASRGWTSK